MKETKSLRLSVHGTTIRTEEFDLVRIPHKVIFFYFIYLFDSYTSSSFTAMQIF